jgi:hypothetical protein
MKKVVFLFTFLAILAGVSSGTHYDLQCMPGYYTENPRFLFPESSGYKFVTGKVNVNMECEENLTATEPCRWCFRQYLYSSTDDGQTWNLMPSGTGSAYPNDGSSSTDNPSVGPISLECGNQGTLIIPDITKLVGANQNNWRYILEIFDGPCPPSGDPNTIDIVYNPGA